MTLNYYLPNGAYPAGDRRNKSRFGVSPAEPPGPPSVPPTPEQWVEIERKASELKEHLRALWKKYDAGRLD